MFDISMQRPESLDALWACMADAGEGGYKILAGATDLVVEARMGEHRGLTWIDITRIPDLPVVEERDGHLWVGTTVTWQELYKHPLAAKHFPGWAECAFRFGSPQIRNLGTIGGNVCQTSPVGDSLPMLMVYDAVAVLASKDGGRELTVEDFMTGVRQNALEPGEILTGFKIPFSGKHATKFLKLGPRESLSISKINAAVRASLDDAGNLTDVRVAIGAAAPRVYRARAAEQHCEGKAPSAELFAEAGTKAQELATPITDWRSDKEYRFAMVKVLTERGLAAVAEALAAS